MVKEVKKNKNNNKHFNTSLQFWPKNCLPMNNHIGSCAPTYGTVTYSNDSHFCPRKQPNYDVFLSVNLSNINFFCKSISLFLIPHLNLPWTTQFELINKTFLIFSLQLYIFERDFNSKWIQVKIINRKARSFEPLSSPQN